MVPVVVWSQWWCGPSGGVVPVVVWSLWWCDLCGGVVFLLVEFSWYIFHLFPQPSVHQVECVGDDLAWMWFDDEGQLRAVNPENGMFSVAPGE